MNKILIDDIIEKLCDCNLQNRYVTHVDDIKYDNFIKRQLYLEIMAAAVNTDFLSTEKDHEDNSPYITHSAQCIILSKEKYLDIISDLLVLKAQI